MIVQHLHSVAAAYETAMQHLHSVVAVCETAMQHLHSVVAVCEMIVQHLHSVVAVCETTMQPLHSLAAVCETAMQPLHSVAAVCVPVRRLIIRPCLGPSGGRMQFAPTLGYQVNFAAPVGAVPHDHSAPSGPVWESECNSPLPRVPGKTSQPRQGPSADAP